MKLGASLRERIYPASLASRLFASSCREANLTYESAALTAELQAPGAEIILQRKGARGWRFPADRFPNHSAQKVLCFCCNDFPTITSSGLRGSPAQFLLKAS